MLLGLTPVLFILIVFRAAADIPVHCVHRQVRLDFTQSQRIAPKLNRMQPTVCSSSPLLQSCRFEGSGGSR